MAEVKWIKITTDIFDDEKILLIESLPDAYAIITVWFKLLCLAGKQNNSGVFMLGQMPYTDKMLATIFRMKESTVTMALNTFEQFGMVEIVDGVITIPNWEKHQSLDQLEQAKEKTRQRVARHREKQKLLAECNVTSNASVTPSNADRIREEREKEEDKENRDIEDKPAPPFKQIVDLYHSICKSFPAVRTLSEARKKAIKARLNTYTVEDFKTLFEMAEASAFLKGSNDRNWTATFDWLIKDTNMAKVLEGNYVDKPKKSGRKEIVPRWCAATNPEETSLDMEGFEEDLAHYRPKYKPKTAADDESIRVRAEALKKQFSG